MIFIKLDNFIEHFIYFVFQNLTIDNDDGKF